MKRPRLITVDELRAAGALDVPPAWRKSLAPAPQRELFSDLVDDDEAPSHEAAATRIDPGHKEPKVVHGGPKVPAPR